MKGYEFLLRHLESHGYEFIFPYLKTEDIINLSEVCRVFLPYRYKVVSMIGVNRKVGFLLKKKKLQRLRELSLGLTCIKDLRSLTRSLSRMPNLRKLEITVRFHL